MIIDGVKVTADFEAEREELAAYVAYARVHTNAPLTEVTVKLCDDGQVDVSYLAKGEKFERIRRITGYLVGTIDRWNDSKIAEERDRVKHI